MKFGINAGHTLSGAGSGAVGLINESIESRNVTNKLIALLNANGHEVVNCTIDKASTQKEYLKKVVDLANEQTLDYFISIHFNAGGGKGVEVYTYEGRQFADALEVCSNISTLGFPNRGVKNGTGLYVVHKSKAKAMLVEVCFVDSDDATKYKSLGVDAFAEAIYNAIIDVAINHTVNPKISYNGHVQDLGWTPAVCDSATCGSVGQGKRLEAIHIDTRLSNLEITAKAHIQKEGWIDYGLINHETEIGTVGKSESLECLCLGCNNANVVYRVHVQNVGWSAWTKADGISTLGSVGQALQLEAIEIKVI